MNSKTLLLLGAVGALAMASAEAQVYSVNAVGYVNVTIPANSFALVANPLKSSDYSLNALLPNQPDGLQVFKYVPTVGYKTFTYDGLDQAWTGAGLATDGKLAPGEGIFVRNTSASPLVFTFVGDVPTGALTTAVPAGFSILSSQVPQAGRIDTVLGFPGQDGDQIFRYLPASGYRTYTFDGLDNAWTGPAGDSVPTLAVGEAFFMRSAAAKNWTRNFSVN